MMTDPDAVAVLTHPPANGRAERGIATLPERERDLWLMRRRALLMELAAIEAFLGIVPRVERNKPSPKIESVIELS